MPTKSRNVSPDQSVNYLNRIKVKNSGYIDEATSAGFIDANSIVAVVGSSADTYVHVDEAQDGADEAFLWLATHQIREFGSVTKWGFVPFDTSAGAKKDPVHLSDATPGALVLVAPAGSPIVVGLVVIVGTVANGGMVFVDLSGL